ncbi:hypothetical protein MBOE_39060 [Mycolicibacterium boenickei]|uniref:Uncharacterized protein n=1 Tax=Mycolicibacterium boenickei TaxID=146017 RepID=A0ABN5ZGC4_9MYCO|nr:hypothetical protein MBOE_39060 [Mycolicibacterium boenickei]
MIVDLGTQLLFLDDGLLLVFARLALLECRLVLELAVVHDLADRWSGIRSYFDKVEIGIRGDAEGVFDAHNAYLLATWSDQADFWYTNALVDAGLSADGASYVGSAEETRPPALLPLRTEKPCSKQGPMPTDHGLRRLHLQWWSTEPVPEDTGDRTVVPCGQRWEWDSTCCP